MSNEGAPGRAAFAFIFVTVMLDMLALGIIIPVLPKLVVEFRAGDTASAARVVGAFGFVWALTQFFVAPLLGACSDRFGRRPVILLSNLGLGLDYILMALAPSLPWLFVGRAINGITSASIPTAIAYVADVTPAEQRAGKFGMINAAFGLGFIVGPAVGGLLGGIDLRFPFWAAAVLSLANATYGFFILPESLPPERRSKFTWAMASPMGAVRLLASYPMLAGLVLAMFLHQLAHESLPSLFVLYTDHRYHWTETQVGLTLGLVGVCTTVVSAVLVGRAVKRFGERVTLATGLLSGMVGFSIYGLAPTGPLFLIGVPCISLWMMAGPSMNSLMTRQVDPSDQGKLQGALSSLKAITGMTGPVLFTQVFAAAVDPGGLLGHPGIPYGLAAACMLLALIASRWRASQMVPLSSPGCSSTA